MFKNKIVMKKLFLFGLMGLVGLMGNMAQGQLLYKISGNGLKAPSYVIGTYHLAPVSFVDSIPGLHEALKYCDQVYGEVNMAEEMSPENIEKMQNAQMLPEGTTFQSLFDEEQMKRINALMREVMGVDFTNTLVAKQMERVSPAAMTATLTVLVCMKKTPGFDPKNLFDNYFQTVALEDGKSVKGFETADFQMDVLYGAPIEKQVSDMMCYVDHFEEAMKQVDDILNAFFSQNFELMSQVFDEEEQGPCDGDPEDYARLLDNRNADWLKQMPKIMQEMPTFFAVGAGHLIGEKGLIAQLRGMGYTVEGVK